MRYLRVVRISNKQDMLSILIFSKDDTEKAIDTIHEVYDFADEIIVVDQSSSKNKNLLLSEKRKKHLIKLKVVNALPLGYVGPLFRYGENKCLCKWILMLDTDEKPNEFFKNNIRKELETSKAQGLNVYFKSKDAQKGISYDEYRLKIYQKGTMEYDGILHQIPSINGKVQDLNPSFVLFHDFNYVNNEKKLERYFKIEAFTNRITYKDVLDLMQKRSMNSSVLKLYFRLKGVKNELELTKFDYIILQTLYMFLVYLLEFPRQSFKSTMFTIWYNNKKFDYFFSSNPAERQNQLEISREIKKNKGVINYLGFNNDAVVDNLYEKFKNKVKNPTDFFVCLLKERKQKGKNYYQYIS